MISNFGKTLAVLFLAFVAVFTFTASAEAQSFALDKVEVNGETVYTTTQVKTLEVARDSTLNVAVVITTTKDVRGLSIEADLRGHEKDIEDETELFDAVANRTYIKYLTLKLPNNIDAIKDYTLRVSTVSSDPAENIVANIKLTVQRSRHKLEILQFEVPSTVNAGDSFTVNVVAKNRGYRKEDDVFVKVSVPELGISKQKLLGDLVPVDSSDPDKEDTLETDLVLTVPVDAKAGNYLVKATVYNSDTQMYETVNLFVKGVVQQTTQPTTQPTQTQVNGATLVVDASTKEVIQGQGVAYALTLTNTGNTAITYSAEVIGVEPFGTSQVNPTSLTLAPGQTGTISVFVKSLESAVEGEKAFTVNVKSDGKVSKSVQLKAIVKEQQDTLQRSLIVAGIILIVILVILVIVLASTRKQTESESLY